MEDTDYGQSAIMAFELMKNDGIPAREAWQIAVEKIFEGRPSSIAKGCPRNVFLYLVGANCKNGKNASYAREALNILDNMDEIEEAEINNMSPREFWIVKMNKGKNYNNQIDVVFALRSKGYI
ncbi:DUF6979 family protein [Phascolarctobacterium faecium]|uniref:DUF6979 family protein n=1 Tax=Phascolarctobacterium faecium TaxID=33025 RepID=UPI00265E8795|nr:hypothetical protein [Phascolarctobacterium faecium]